MNRISFVLSICVLLTACPNHAFAQRQLSNKQRANLLKRFPAADRDKDGKLSNAEIQAFTKRMRGGGGGIQRNFKVDPGWKLERFPDHAACYKSPAELKELFSKSLKAKPPQARTKVVTSYEKPTDGSLRIVGTGHSFMAPG